MNKSDVKAAALYHREERMIMYGFQRCGTKVRIDRKGYNFTVTCMSCRKVIKRWRPTDEQIKKARQFKLTRASWERFLKHDRL